MTIISDMLKTKMPLWSQTSKAVIAPVAPFAGRIIDFSDRTLRFALKTGPLKPYEAFLPGFSFGFEKDALIVLRLAKAEDGAPALFCEIEARMSRWLTLEIALDHEMLKRTRAAFAMIEAAAAPRIAIKTGLRIPQRKAEEGFVDSSPFSFVLDSAIGNTTFSFPVLQSDIEPFEGIREAKLILFMPLKNFSVCLRRLSIAPTGL